MVNSTVKDVNRKKSLPTAERLLNAAVELYLREGLQGLSMRRVAEAVQVSAPAIYRHFRSKEDLLVAMIERGFGLFAAYLHDALAESSPEDRLFASGRRYVDFALEHHGYYTLLFMAPALWPTPAVPEAVQLRGRSTFQFLVDRVRECMDSGWELGPGDPEAVARSIWAMTHGLVSLYLAGRLVGDEAAFRQNFRQTQRDLIEGLRRAP